MKEFKACLKKEVLEQLRTGKFFIFTAIGIGMALFSFVTLGMMQAINMLGLDMGSLAASFTPTFANGTMMFMAFMQSYFYIPVLIMIMSCVSKEIKQKKWTLPISSGISPSKMIAAKFVVVVGSVAVASIISMLVHFGITMLLSLVFMEPQISWASDISGMFRSYGLFLVFTVFLMIVTIAMNAITKKGWPAIVVGIISIMFVPMILGVIMVGTTSFISYTPFYFLNEVSKATYLIPNTVSASTAELISSYTSTVVISALLIFFAIKSTKVSKIAQ